MKVDEAYSILGVDKTATEDQLKTKYKQLAKEYHPDINKNEPDKFKSINEAYQLITDYKQNPAKYEQRNSFPGAGFQYQHVNFDDIFSQFGDFSNASNQKHPPPQLHIKITFNQSVLGEDRQIKYTRFAKCSGCNGMGLERVGNGCASCDGFGRSVSRGGGMVFAQTCNKCYGKNVKKNQCNKCVGKSVISSEIAGSISIPPGVLDNATLRLQGAGHYAGSGIFGDAYGDVLVNVSVEKDDDLKLDGNNVISHLELSLLDALSGCEREIKTVYGNKTITIPQQSKHNEIIHIEKCGVKNTTGTQCVILDIIYPENIDKLINFLKKKEKIKNADEHKL